MLGSITDNKTFKLNTFSTSDFHNHVHLRIALLYLLLQQKKHMNPVLLQTNTQQRSCHVHVNAKGNRITSLRKTRNLLSLNKYTDVGCNLV